MSACQAASTCSCVGSAGVIFGGDESSKRSRSDLAPSASKRSSRTPNAALYWRATLASAPQVTGWPRPTSSRRATKSARSMLSSSSDSSLCLAIGRDPEQRSHLGVPVEVVRVEAEQVADHIYQ